MNGREYDELLMLIKNKALDEIKNFIENNSYDLNRVCRTMLQLRSFMLCVVEMKRC